MTRLCPGGEKSFLPLADPLMILKSSGMEMGLNCSRRQHDDPDRCTADPDRQPQGDQMYSAVSFSAI